MNRDGWKNLLSYLLMALGTVLVFLGTHTLLESYFGQTAAAREFRTAASPATNVSQAAASRGPQRGETMAQLTIPRLDTQLYVIEGDDASELQRGPGHLAGSAMPGRPWRRCPSASPCRRGSFSTRSTGQWMASACPGRRR